jgi:hypothetical protein
VGFPPSIADEQEGNFQAERGSPQRSYPHALRHCGFSRGCGLSCLRASLLQAFALQAFALQAFALQAFCIASVLHCDFCIAAAALRAVALRAAQEVVQRVAKPCARPLMGGLSAGSTVGPAWVRPTSDFVLDLVAEVAETKQPLLSRCFQAGRFGARLPPSSLGMRLPPGAAEALLTGSRRSPEARRREEVRGLGMGFLNSVDGAMRRKPNIARFRGPPSAGEFRGPPSAGEFDQRGRGPAGLSPPERSAERLRGWEFGIPPIVTGPGLGLWCPVGNSWRTELTSAAVPNFRCSSEGL